MKQFEQDNVEIGAIRPVVSAICKDLLKIKIHDLCEHAALLCKINQVQENNPVMSSMEKQLDTIVSMSEKQLQTLSQLQGRIVGTSEVSPRSKTNHGTLQTLEHFHQCQSELVCEYGDALAFMVNIDDRDTREILQQALNTSKEAATILQSLELQVRNCSKRSEWSGAGLMV